MERSIAFIRQLSGIVLSCPVDLHQSIDEQILDIENFCGLFPKDAYFVHRGKTVSPDIPLQAQGIVRDCNIEVLLRLRGGGKPKRGSGRNGRIEAAIQELSDRIDSLKSSHDKPEDIEVEVRALYSEIDSMEDTSAKKKLLAQLTAEAIAGLEKDLQELLKENGLRDKSLQLVRDYTTWKRDLAKKLYQSKTSGTDMDESYGILAAKLLPKLETLGARLSNNVEVGTQAWVGKLIERSPTLNKLRRMNYSDLDNLIKEATVEDRSVVEDVFAEGSEIREQCRRYGIGLKTAEKLEKKGIKSASDMSREQLDQVIKEMGSEENGSNVKKMYFNESSERAMERKEQKEKIEQNKKRIEEAKELAENAHKIAQEASEESKDELRNKVKEIADKLSLPEGWDKQDKDDPNELLQQLNNEINIASDSLSIPPYVTNEDIATAASGGLALYGILFDNHDIEDFSKSPPFPLLKKPGHVEWLSPSLGFQVHFFKSTEQYASTKFYKTAKSSGLSIAASVSGSGYGYHASASAAHSSEGSEETSDKLQRQTTHATITQYICQPTKAFRIPTEDLELNYEAKTRAEKIKDEESAERFLEMYGSHVSEGVHTLGGVFFRNLDVTTDRSANVSDVMRAAGSQLDTDISAGYSGFGVSVGGSVKTSSFEVKGSRDAKSTEKINCMSEMTVQTLGPPTTNPQMFSQLLQSNNATWYVIDRGDRAALVPVWQLISDREQQADLLEKVWKEKQKKKEKRANNTYPLKGYNHTLLPGQDLCIDLASEGVPDQAYEVIVYAKIAKGWNSAGLDEDGGMTVSSTISNGVIERKLACHFYDQNSWSYNSENIPLPVARDGERVVRVSFIGPTNAKGVTASAQIVGYSV
ncbi:uncharacterized protein [Montipora capricornis]|uniref:uncharacterized protein n=1 Tax=Montipora capricornis TaxID=246305 RepID=UPI0035F14197